MKFYLQQDMDQEDTKDEHKQEEEDSKTTCMFLSSTPNFRQNYGFNGFYDGFCYSAQLEFR